MYDREVLAIIVLAKLIAAAQSGYTPDKNFCVDRRDGKFQLAECSREYALCSSNRLELQRCPGSATVYSSMTKSCTSVINWIGCDPQNETSEQKICAKRADGVYALGPCSQAYAICFHRKYYPAQCKIGYVYNEQVGGCGTIKETWQCASGFRAVPFRSYCFGTARGTARPISACNGDYVMCRSETATIASRCPSQQVFVPDQGCMPPATVPMCSSAWTSTFTKSMELDAAQELLQVNLFCSSRPNGVYLPVASDCVRSIVLCSSGSTRIIACPAGYYFDEQSYYCKSAAENRVCQQALLARGRQSSYVDGLLKSVAAYSCQVYKTDYIGTPQQCNAWYIDCTTTTKSVRLCAEGFSFDLYQKRCVTSSSCVKNMWSNDLSTVCKNARNSLVSMLPCSPRYFACLNGRAFPQTCSSKDTVFSEQQQRCVLTSSHPHCNNMRMPISLGISRFVKRCPRTLGSALYSVAPCSPYYVACNFGRPSWKTCRPGQTFSAVLGSCVDKSKNHQCSVLPPQPPVIPTRVAPFLQEPCFHRKDSFLLRLSCSRFWAICRNRKMVIMSCAVSFVYDVTSKQCVKATGSQASCSINKEVLNSPNPCLRQPNQLVGIAACDRLYYACFDQMTYWQVCKEGYAFDRQRQQCFPRHTVKECITPAVTPTLPVRCKVHGAFLPDLSNRSKFFRCVYGKLVPFYCPTGTVFNPRINVCDWPA